MSKETERGSRDTAASLERHSTLSYSIYVASCLFNTSRTWVVLDDGSSATLRRTRHRAAFLFIRD